MRPSPQPDPDTPPTPIAAPDEQPDLDNVVDSLLDTSHHDMIVTMDVLQTLGVSADAACRFGKTICKDPAGFADLFSRLDHNSRMVSSLTGTRPSLLEVYGVGNIVDAANGIRRNLNIDGLDALDLRTNKKTCDAWDVSKSSDRQEAMQLVIDTQPRWVIGSPPCTAFSTLNTGLNYKRMSPEKVAAMMKEGRMHLHFVLSLYKVQLDSGRHFLHEHPSGASSWKDPWTQRLLQHPKVHTATSDQCMYGLTTIGHDGELQRAKKPTKWMTSSPWMAKRLSTRCTKDHIHQPLLGGRARAAETYPA